MKTKKFLVVVFALAFSFAAINNSFAQEKKISQKDLPNAVVKSFQAKYPKAEIKGTAVEKENGHTYYEIESMDGTQKRDLLYTKDGKVAEIEEGISLENIPSKIKSSVMKKYPEGKIKNAEKVTSNSKTTFELLVEHNGKKSVVVLDEKGNIQKMEKSEKENDEKDSKEESNEEDED